MQSRKAKAEVGPRRQASQRKQYSSETNELLTVGTARSNQPVPAGVHEAPVEAGHRVYRRRIVLGKKPREANRIVLERLRSDTSAAALSRLGIAVSV